MRCVRKAALAIVICCFFGGISQAADPVLKASDRSELPIPEWSGIYAGGHFGWGWAQESLTLAAFEPGAPIIGLGARFSGHRDGALGGGQIGVDWQLPTAPWIVGVEGEWSWTNAQAASTVSATGTSSTGIVETDWYAAVSGRIGYAWDRSLLFVKSGAAFSRVSYYAITDPGHFLSTTTKDTRVGWLIGLGLEQQFSERWSWKIEYNFLGLADTTISLSTPALGTSSRNDSGASVHLVKVGINYRLGNGKEQIVAKY